MPSSPTKQNCMNVCILVLGVIAGLESTFLLVWLPEDKRIENDAQATGCTDAIVGNASGTPGTEVTCTLGSRNLTFFCADSESEQDLCVRIRSNRELTVSAFILLPLSFLLIAATLALILRDNRHAPAQCLLNTAQFFLNAAISLIPQDTRHADTTPLQPSQLDA